MKHLVVKGFSTLDGSCTRLIDNRVAKYNGRDCIAHLSNIADIAASATHYITLTKSNATTMWRGGEFANQQTTVYSNHVKKIDANISNIFVLLENGELKKINTDDNKQESIFFDFPIVNFACSVDGFAVRLQNKTTVFFNVDSIKQQRNLIFLMGDSFFDKWILSVKLFAHLVVKKMICSFI